MSDLRDRFRELDEIQEPDLWREIKDRSAVPQRRAGLAFSWVLVGTVAFLALVAGGAAAVGSGVVRLPSGLVRSAAPSSTPEPPDRTPAASPAASPAATPSVSSAWTAASDMIAARAVQSASLLPDGRVLIAGGFNGTDAFVSAELFDPATGQWSATGDMVESRAGHTATLLPDGTVLVAGGGACPAGGPVCPELASAELYDPATGRWTATGDMHAARIAHTATLLPNGTVLVAGGTTIGGDASVSVELASAELYDPATGSWTVTGDMSAARTGHTATLLPDGTVLVAGGSVSPNDRWRNLASAELYDPATGSWTATGDMSAARTGHTATLLRDGTVLVVGDCCARIAVAELYDPATGSWTATGPMIERRGWHTAALLPDGMVLVAGGANGGSDGHFTNTAELYDPSSHAWVATRPLARARKFHTATLLPDGHVLVAGGTEDIIDGTWIRTATAEIYDPVGSSGGG